MSTAAVSLSDVEARWAYSEIVDSNVAHRYGSDCRVESLRAKRRADVSFTHPTSDERCSLKLMCACVRAPLVAFLRGIESFEVVALTKMQLSALHVPPAVSQTNGLITFERYLDTPSSDPGDARNIVATPKGYRSPDHPMTVGRRSEKSVLVDGYHRAVAFWKYAPAESVIPAYCPRPRCIGVST